MKYVFQYCYFDVWKIRVWKTSSRLHKLVFSLYHVDVRWLLYNKYKGKINRRNNSSLLSCDIFYFLNLTLHSWSIKIFGNNSSLPAKYCQLQPSFLKLPWFYFFKQIKRKGILFISIFRFGRNLLPDHLFRKLLLSLNSEQKIWNPDHGFFFRMTFIIVIMIWALSDLTGITIH